MANTVRTIDFLPEIFKTKTNEQFLSATLDQLTQQPDFRKVQGFIGSKFGYGVSNSDAYVSEPNKTRTNYQLEPAVIFKKKDTEKAVDLITYPGLIDAVALEGGVVANNNNLFNNEFYSWDSFVDLDKLINYNQYYWLPHGPEALTLGTLSIYKEATFIVSTNVNGFTFVQNEIPVEGTNPIITLVRGGTYKFHVSQNSPFWIQTNPDVSGVDPTHTNISTREIFGIENNGISNGTITFTVPPANAQNEYLLSNSIKVDLATDLPFDQINGKRLADLKNIDGVTDVEGKTLIFYGTAPGEQGFINEFYDTGSFGGTTGSNDVQFEQGTYTTINNHYYRINLVGDPLDPVIKIAEAGYLQNDERIIIRSGKEYIGREFVRNSFFEIVLVPVMTAGLDTYYYRDGVNPLRVGKIKIIDNASTDYIDVTDIIGAKTYTSPNNITLTNGLKIQFLSNVWPEEYRRNQYYVEGVGSSIKLIPVTDLVVPELYSQSLVAPFDSGAFDSLAFGNAFQVPVDQDYITINRAAQNKNAWSRSNRWFHEDVLKLVVSSSVRSPNATAALKDPNARAKRPIVEFYPDLKLFNTGTIAKKPVDFINFTATNAFTQVAGQVSYEPDGAGSALFEGARIVFAGDNAVNVRNKIYVVSFVKLTENTDPVITLSVAPDGNIQYNEQVVSLGGIDNKAKTIYFDGSVWHVGQQKVTVNQKPLFDVFDANNNSFGDTSFYPGTDFVGNSLFQYAEGTGSNDAVLGFPVKYSSISNVGDITFENTLNTKSFNYVDGVTSKTVSVGTGYVFNYTGRNSYTREIGWKTAVEKSFQYQVFDFTYTAASLSQTFVCDVAALTEEQTAWVPIVVYVDNNRTTAYTSALTANTTSITITETLGYGSTVQVMIYSNQASKVAYYQIPDNLDKNPFNEQITTINLGEIRGHYKSICNNVRTLTGDAFGANNYRDLGNLVSYGTRIIQNSAPLPVAAAFLRSKDLNFFDAVDFNSNEYIKFKSLLIDTIDRLDLNALQDNASILDLALDKVSTSKLQTSPFFWSDMLPQGNAIATNSYTFALGAIPSVYSLTRVYDFKSANYYGVLVYLSRVESGVVRVRQLLKDIDYSVSETEKSLVLLTTDVAVGDILTIKEYNQTYGSYVPNTPTKLGLYPLFKPEVVLDDTYVNPTYFIKGHDGSYTKLFGEYNDGYLQDFRDRALIEFETRIFNNMKVQAKIPVEFDDVFPGQFRTTDFTTTDLQQVYNTLFLNWIGANRVEYKSQYYVTTDEHTWNYRGSVNKLDNLPVTQGHWKGLYLWMYDTVTPHITPWEMLGLSLKPSWWDKHYGSAPYTSDNKLLWEDISKGFVWNDGDSYVNPKRVRPGLLNALPVDHSGNLLLPIESMLSGYDYSKFKNSWAVGDMGPTEFTYRKSSSWPFDLIKICGLSKPALFFTLGFNLDAYRYNSEFKQYLVGNRTRALSKYMIEYGTDNTTPSHSYLNWMVDFQRQYGVLTTTTFDTLKNLDVRLTYRVAGFTDKDMMKFFVEKGSPNSKNSSLLIPDESYSILLYDNQANTVITYSSVIVQKTETGFKVYGNSQKQSYFVALIPINNGNYDTIAVNGLTVQVSKNYSTVSYNIPYGTEFDSARGLSEFLKGYGKYLEAQGMIFNDIENGLELNWDQMIAETLYWVQSGWEIGSTVNVNPCANLIAVNKESNIVQPLTVHHDNFILNQNLLPIQLKDLSIYRNGTLFTAKALNQGDSISFFTARLSTIEHVVVFDNNTLFNDSIFNLITGLRQQRLYVKGTKTTQWNGSMNASGFIMNQDNITEWVENQKYTKGSIVTYKNSYWVAKDKSAPPSAKFDTSIWVKTNFDQIQKGLLPNPSTRAYESTLYYDATRTNLETDGDLLSFSLIGYRPRAYLVEGDLDDSTQINVYKNMLGEKGTNLASVGLNNITVQHNPLQYTVHENWAIKTGEFGGILNQNFIEVALDEVALKGNPSIVSVVKDTPVDGAEQQVNLKDIKNYGRILGDDKILTTINGIHDDMLPSAGYVNLDDVYATAYTVDRLDNALINNLYKNDYIWVADKASSWDVFSAFALQINLETVINNLNGTITLIFDGHHGLSKNDPIGVLNFDDKINGFYTINSVTDLYTVVVTKELDKSINTLSGSGLTFKLQSQRVGTGKDINYLSLLQNEYAREKVWVDVGTTGEWVVYEKANNYKDTQFSKVNAGVTFGYASTYIPDIGYFIADPGNNVVHHYKKFGNNYVTVADITPPPGVSTTTFGVSIHKSNDLVFIADSNPAAGGSSHIFIYKIVNEKLLQTLSLDQVISFDLPPWLATRFGDVMAISGDGKFMYVSALDFGAILTFVLDEQYHYARITDNIDNVDMTLSSDIELHSNNFTVDGDWASDNAHTTIVQGKYVTFDDHDPSIIADASVYTILSARYNSSTNKTTFYIVETFNETYSAGTPVLTASNNYSCWVDDSDYAILLGRTDTSTSEGYGMSLATNYDGSTLVVGSPYSDTVIDENNIIQDTGSVNVYNRLVETFEMEYDGTKGQLAVFYLAWYPNPFSMVYLNGKRLTRALDYVILPGTYPILVLDGERVKAGDIITISGMVFLEPYTMYSYDDPTQARAGELFGYSVDCNTTASEIIVGSPFDAHNVANQEGAVHRFTNEGKKFGTCTGLGVAELSISGSKNIFINGFVVKVTSNDAAGIATQINDARINNVYAYATDDGRLIISLRDVSLNPNNNKLNLVVVNNHNTGLNFWNSFHIYPYIRTQVITDQHKQTRAQFGFKVKFNEFNSFAVSAPVATRYVGTTFDFSDDENSHNDAVFDNNLTQWEDVTPGAGAVYMYDYVSTYNETIFNIGEFIYAQSCNDTTDASGAQSYYGSSLSFNDYVLIIGNPGYLADTVGGRSVIYENAVKTQNWSTYRKATNVVDINKIQKIQLYNSIDSTVLESLDYFDPLQGKLLGAVRENIDFISIKDPAGYNNSLSFVGNKVWGKNQIGKIWFNTSTTRFLNYHQNDVVYDSKHWGQVFPGSEVAVYTWIASDVTPANYMGQGTPFDLTKYSVSYHNDSSENLVATYYFWVQNTNTIFDTTKVLTDTVIQNYITSPQSSGIAYAAPVRPNAFALYNSAEFIRGKSTNLLVNYSISTSDASNHVAFKLIRTNYEDDFLPGFPNKSKGLNQPYGLYDRLVDSLSGTDEVGALVPDPALPKMVQTGIGVRPRQSFFSDRFTALRNYFEYVNNILAQYPITEIQNLTFLNASGDYFTTSNYWNYTYWWATGYNSATRTSFDVVRFADLSTIENPYEGLVVGVLKNIQNKREVYAYTSGAWTRVGLENGTIQFIDSLWDYQANKIGFGDNFFDSVSFDQFPSVETRYIVRAINEQIFKGELFKYRNEGLIRLFEYIQSENIANNNYMPWLTKTSLLDVGYTARKLETYQKYQRDNQSFLEGYMDEIKPYHVVIKDFFLRYEGEDTYDATFTDFDLPAKYNAAAGKFITPQLRFDSYDPKYQFLPTDKIWTDIDYSQWFDNYGLILRDAPNTPVTTLASYISYNSTSVQLDNVRGMPSQGTIRIGTELINYLDLDRNTGRLIGVTRSYNASMGSGHVAGSTVYMDLPSVTVLYTGRAYSVIPKVSAVVDTTKYPAPKRQAVLRAVMANDKVIAVETVDPGDGYVVTPEIRFDYAYSVTGAGSSISVRNHTFNLPTTEFVEGEIVKFETTSGSVPVVPNGFYYIHIAGTNVVDGQVVSQFVTLHTQESDVKRGKNPVKFNANYSATGYEYVIGVSAYAVPTLDNNRIRGMNTVLKFDRTSYTSKVKEWKPGEFWASEYSKPENSASSGELITQTTSLTSAVGTVISVVGATSDGNDNTIVTLDYASTGLTPGQISGVLMYFFTYYDSYTYTDPVGGAIITVSRPKFNPNTIVGMYQIYIDSANHENGANYTDGDTIVIPGSLLGGVDGTNDAVVSVDYVGLDGEIIESSVSGVPVTNSHLYYLKPITETTALVYKDANLTIPVKLNKFTFDSGDYAFIPNPIVAGPGYASTTASIVTYNNQIWKCIEGNNDQTFDTTKWVKVAHDDWTLNALDRISAFYTPTVGMPGKDFSQLVSGVTYPYNTYIGNSFAPEDQYENDYEIRDNPFYPSNLKIRGIVPHKTKDVSGNEYIDYYVAVADDTDKTVVLIGDETNWSIVPISHTPLDSTGISYSRVNDVEEIFVITTNTKAMPLLVSYDAHHWVTLGDFIPFDTVPWDLGSYAISGLGGNIAALQSSIGVNGTFFATGNNIIKTTDGVEWTEVFTFGSALTNAITDITYIDGVHYSGFVAVGYGETVVQYAGSSSPVIQKHSRIITSSDGDVWTLDPTTLTSNELHFVFGTDTAIVTGGSNGSVWSMISSTAWLPATIDVSTTATLRSGAFGNGVFVIVGDSGTILYSSDGDTWTNNTAGSTTTNNLYKVTFDGNRFYAVGDMDTVLTSSDGELWINQSNVQVQEPEFTIKGSDFASGYGPEELVAGLTFDNLVMKVTSTDPSLSLTSTYTLHVDKNGESHVYRTNNQDITTLTTDVSIDANTIQVDDVSKLTGELIVIGSEIIKFRTKDAVNNTISGLVRGAMGTSPSAHSAGDVVYPLGVNNKLADQYYSVVWNSRNEPLHGDPFTQSTTPAAIFLNTV